MAASNEVFCRRAKKEGFWHGPQGPLSGQSDILTDIAEWQIYKRSLASPAALLQANEKCARAAQNVAIYPRLAVHNPRRRTTHV
ncbi:MAG: hypothetical protein ACI9KS_000100, partial [Sulfitobacter sp.]